MNISSLEKARSRLRAAKRAVDAMAGTDDPNTICDHWIDFLNAWIGVYRQVKKAATSTPQEYQWFGRVAREKTNDPLLNYVFEARNDEEHGVNRSAVPHYGLANFPQRSHETVIASVRFDPGTGEVRVYGPDGQLAYDPVLVSPPGVVLDPITARGNRTIAPPTFHLGDPINPDVLTVAKAALVYAAKLVAMAEAMHTPSQ